MLLRKRRSRELRYFSILVPVATFDTEFPKINIQCRFFVQIGPTYYRDALAARPGPRGKIPSVLAFGEFRDKHTRTEIELLAPSLFSVRRLSYSHYMQMRLQESTLRARLRADEYVFARNRETLTAMMADLEALVSNDATLLERVLVDSTLLERALVDATS